jgi:hypothetical protein
MTIENLGVKIEITLPSAESPKVNERVVMMCNCKVCLLRTAVGGAVADERKKHYQREARLP